MPEKHGKSKNLEIIILSVISSKMLKRNDEKNVENTNSDSLVSKLSVALQGESF